MPPAPGRAALVLASADDGAAAFHGQTARPAGKSLRPTNGRLALGELPARVMGATTIEALLSSISGAAQVPFGRPSAGPL
jgi:hypothetical protein